MSHGLKQPVQTRHDESLANHRGPIRSCVVCRARAPKERLVRVVADQAGRIRIDDLRREPGRGAYLHPSRGCVAGLSRKREALGRALRRNVVLTPSVLDSFALRLGPPDHDDRKGNEES